jgi:hypothetical protein
MEMVDLREVHRAAAEVGPVLHGLKSVARQRAVVLMAQNLEDVEDDGAWMVVFACKVRMRTSSPSYVRMPHHGCRGSSFVRS